MSQREIDERLERLEGAIAVLDDRLEALEKAEADRRKLRAERQKRWRDTKKGDAP